MKGRRPVSIRWFEWLNLMSIAVALLYNWLNWDAVVAVVESDGFGPEVAVALMAIIYSIYLLLLWLVSRRRSNMFKWIWIAISLLGLIGVLIDYRALIAEGAFAIALAATQDALLIVALLLLFRPDARRWFAGQDEIDPAAFR